MKSINTFLLLIIAGWLASCNGSEKLRQQLIYFKNVKDSALKVAAAYEPVIQKGDIFSITVSGSILERDAALPILESINKTSGTGSGSSDDSKSGPVGYLVSETGEIVVPFIGSVSVSGLTRVQAADSLKEKIRKEIKDPIIEIRFLNHKYTVLGEVNRPGTQIIVSSRVTLVDAIGAAGDLTVNGKRDNILVIREINGKKEMGRINLNEGNIFSSPYYFIQPDDVVYVEMNKLNVPAKQTQTVQYLQIGLSVLTISLLINLFK